MSVRNNKGICVSKRRVIHLTQKIIILIMSAAACLLIFFMWKAPNLNISLLNNTRFTIPNMPDLNQSNTKQTVAMPECITLKLASNDLLLLKTLQSQGWPAYLVKNAIEIGPYLNAFQSQLNLSKISQITSIPVRIANIHFL